MVEGRFELGRRCHRKKKMGKPGSGQCLAVPAALTFFICLVTLLVTGPSASSEDDTPRINNENDIRNWTPGAQGPQPPGQEWRLVDERIWRDSRLKQMDFGPVLGGTWDLKGSDGKIVATARSGLGIRVGDQGQAAVVYEKLLCQCQGGWFGGFFMDGARFGLLYKPGNAAPLLFSAPASPAWDHRGSFSAQRPSDSFPLDRDWADFRGVHFHGKKVVLEYTVDGVRVLEHPWAEGFTKTGQAITRSFEVAKCNRPMVLRVVPMPNAVFRYFGEGCHAFQDRGTEVALVVGRAGVTESRRLAGLALQDGWVVIKVAPHAMPVTFKLLIGPWDDEGKFETLATQSPLPDPLEPLIRGGAKNWPRTVETSIETEPGDGPYILDHILPPIRNPWNALCYFAGVDFLPNGDVAVCSAHGDVWIASDIASGKPRWKRFATGLYQPLGLKVVDGVIHVLERGQVTRVRDLDGDGEADFLESLNNRWHNPGTPHAFDMGLDGCNGWLYFNKSGEWRTPTGASLLRVRVDGSGDAEVYCTGLRHTNGVSVMPDGRVTCAGQQGNWTPNSRVDICRPGGFYGLMEAAHRNPSPPLFDGPLVWLPLYLDSSSADQVFAPNNWGPLGGAFLHLSWGQCRLIHVMPEKVGGVEQAAACAVVLPRFLSGSARGRFSPKDGHLYVACLNGWQCRETWDGALERVRFVGGEYARPVEVHTLVHGLAITFGTPLDALTVTDRKRYSVKQWNYWWTLEYGSEDWSPRRRGQRGVDALTIADVSLSTDKKTITLTIPDLQPAMQMQVDFDLKTASGKVVKDYIVSTVHRIPLDRNEAGAKPLAAPKPNGWSLTSQARGDAEMRLEFKPSDNGAEGGLCLHWDEKAGTGYRLDLTANRLVFRDVWCDVHTADGKNNAGRVIDVKKRTPRSIATTMRANEWNRLRVRVEGPRIRIWVNDVDVAEYVESDTRVALFGKFGLWMGGTEGLEFRNATVEPLP
jgi:hypothetical protein